MDRWHWLISKTETDYYTRRYTIDPERTSGLPVTVYAECSINANVAGEGFYRLEFFFSAGKFKTREFLAVYLFGTGDISKARLDAAVDAYAMEQIDEPEFPAAIAEYIEREEALETGAARYGGHGI